jgi:hypothetical protein
MYVVFGQSAYVFPNASLTVDAIPYYASFSANTKLRISKYGLDYWVIHSPVVLLLSSAVAFLYNVYIRNRASIALYGVGTFICLLLNAAVAVYLGIAWANMADYWFVITPEFPPSPLSPSLPFILLVSITAYGILFNLTNAALTLVTFYLHEQVQMQENANGMGLISGRKARDLSDDEASLRAHGIEHAVTEEFDLLTDKSNGPSSSQEDARIGSRNKDSDSTHDTNDDNDMDDSQ